ncbi:UDP-3-O-(3-hydroxymyristoyl)glucosamine N-acyltransferase [Pseudanabaena sp. PCC 6802]|uniref:UDP-3-O-(3-hydroxymyristoyl)glucosamine N-acyltransferase n=1 Tax=Pseudanabaena sp. PCC 6802 TaxID=118173 RepID=UPI000345E484|nr:UDP-3-O-(3-hydroxymyristoyl)glucosamine N-acyltransferase [Pseudanabaena sp. PCC 6802]
MKLSELASRLSGCQLDAGDRDPEITGVAALDRAQPGELTFLSSTKYLPLLQSTQASAAILDLQTPCDLPCLRTSNPRLVFAHAIALFYQPPQVPIGIHPTAIIGQDVQLGKDVAIAAGVVIGDRVHLGGRATIFPNTTIYNDVKLGDNTTIHANCVIREHSQIGSSCIIHPNTVIGGDGFGYEIQDNGTWFKIPQSGCVVVADNVEIGCLSAIDRPSVGTTEIATGTKIDNLVQIGHGSKVGPHCILVSQVGLAGGVNLGHHVVLAGQVGIADHADIGDGAVLGAKSGVVSYVEPGTRMMGYPVVPEKDWKRIVVAERQLPEMLHKLRKLEKRIAELEGKAGVITNE